MRSPLVQIGNSKATINNIFPFDGPYKFVRCSKIPLKYWLDFCSLHYTRLDRDYDKWWDNVRSLSVTAQHRKFAALGLKILKAKGVDISAIVNPEGDTRQIQTVNGFQFPKFPNRKPRTSDSYKKQWDRISRVRAYVRAMSVLTKCDMDYHEAICELFGFGRIDIYRLGKKTNIRTNIALSGYTAIIYDNLTLHKGFLLEAHRSYVATLKPYIETNPHHSNFSLLLTHPKFSELIKLRRSQIDPLEKTPYNEVYGKASIY